MLSDRDRAWLAERSAGMLTLGWQVGLWIQQLCVIPDGEQAGDPFLLSRPQWWFLLKHYELRADITDALERFRARSTARHFMAFRYRRSQLTRSQKWGKGPFACAMICAEAGGPVVFDGFDAAGEPVGKEWASPLIQVVAFAGDQTDNIWSALLPMIQLGDLTELYPDAGLSRVNVPGGKIEPVTSADRSRLGARCTFVVQDQTESWTDPKLRDLADTMLRGVAGIGGRSIETPNAWDPAERSVAQVTYEAAAPDVYLDYPEPPRLSITNRRERKRAIRFAYDGAPWVDQERIDAEIVALLAKGDPGQAERWYLNRIVAGADQAFSADLVRRLILPRDPVERRKIAAGFDGSRRLDSTGLVCVDLETGHAWAEEVWERPAHLHPDDESWQVDAEEVTSVVDSVFERYDVWRLYADPAGWTETTAYWASRHGADTIVDWPTAALKKMVYAVKEFAGDLATAAALLDGDDDAVPRMVLGCGDERLDGALERHILNAVRYQTRMRDPEDDRWLWYPRKDSQKSRRKIDLLICLILAWKARTDAIRSGALRRRGRIAAW